MSRILLVAVVMGHHVRIKITACARPGIGEVGETIGTGVVLIDQRCPNCKRPGLLTVTGAAISPTRPRNVQRIMQDLKEILLLVGRPETNNTVRIRIGIPWGIWSGMVDVRPVTRSFVGVIDYRRLYPK